MKTYKTKRAIDVINAVLPATSPRLTRPALLSWGPYGVKPPGMKKGVQGMWPRFSILIAFWFKVLMDAGLSKEFAGKQIPFLEMKVRMGSIGPYCWFDVFINNQGVEIPQIIDDPRQRPQGRRPDDCQLIIGVNLSETARRIDEELAKK